jgi:hypothetical protein
VGGYAGERFSHHAGGRGGKANLIDRKPGVEVRMKDPLAAHQEMIMTLTNADMHNVTAYLDTLK